jgi:uncharacterized protein (DUF302 family)
MTVADNGLVTLPSAHDVATTVDRLAAALDARRVTIFARIDHAAGAADAGLPLRPTTLVIFGNPATGTPLMQAAQISGIDLPLKALVWQNVDGAAHLTYNDPAWIATRHGVGSDAEQTIQALSAAMAALARHATSAQ